MEETWKHGFTIWEKKRLETKQDIEEENWYVWFGFVAKTTFKNIYNIKYKRW